MGESKEQLNAPQSKTSHGSPSAATTKASSQLSPSVYWAQTEHQITLKVDLKDAKVCQNEMYFPCKNLTLLKIDFPPLQPPHVDFTPKSLTFAAKGIGARGFNEYKFDLSFYGFISDEVSI